MKPNWTYSLTWFAVVALALLMAFAAPRENGVLGRLPGNIGHKLDLGKSAVPADGEQRFLALVTFHRDHRKDADSWVVGLQLDRDPSITWIRMPVVHDAGDPLHRSAAEQRLMARYASAQDRAKLLPVFTDREAFVQSTGMRDADHAYVLVFNRQGEVLARVPGGFDEIKAQAVLETLQLRDL